LKVFGNRALRKIFGLKREEVVGGWRRLHREELHTLYASSNIIRVNKQRRMKLGGGQFALMGEKRNA
jgi:PAS domain-containing protein